MAIKVLIYVSYDTLEYENDFNVWIQEENGDFDKEACLNSDEIIKFIDDICLDISEENGIKKVDLNVVKDKDCECMDLIKAFKDRNVKVLKESEWAVNEIEEIIIKEFGGDFQYEEIKDKDTISEKTYIENVDNRCDDKPVVKDKEVPLSLLMREVAKGGNDL